MLTLDTVSTAYASITTSWDAITDVTWTKLRLVRSATGTPRDERDGDVLFEDDYAIARASYTDTGLTTGRYYYYGLFVLTTNGWVGRGSATFLVTKDWGYTGKLYDSLPEVFKSSDYTAVTDPIVEPEESFLYRFLSVFGFQLDALRSEAESARHLLDAKLTNQALLPALAAQVGVTYEPEIGTRSLRQLIANAIHLWGIKGTVPGVRELASVLTGYVTHVRIGNNLALDGLDAGPTTDKGRWVGKTNCTVTYQVNAATDVNPAGNGVRHVTATAAGATVCDTNPGGTNSLFRRQYAVPVLPGRDYYVSQFLRTAGAATTAQMGAQWLDGNGNSLGPVETPVATTAVGAAWGRVSSLVHAPSGACYLEPSLITGALTTGQVVEACGFAVQEGGLNSNLLTTNQATVETDLTGFGGATNATISRSTAQSLDGSASLAITATSGAATASADAYTNDGANGVRITAGSVYTAVVSFRAATVSRAVRVFIYWYDAAGAGITNVGGATFADNTAGWTQARVTAQAPANAAYALVLASVLSPATGEVHYIDRVGLFPDPTGNLVSTPDFESGTSGWSTNGPLTIARAFDKSYTGRASLLCTFTGGAQAYTQLQLIQGQTYTMTARVWVTSGTVYLGLFEGNGVTGSVSPNSSGTGSWQTLTVTRTIGAVAGLGYFQVRADSPATCYVDAVQVVVGSTAPTWVPPTTTNLMPNPSFDGDSTGWSLYGISGTIEQTTEQSYIGTKSLKHTAVTTGYTGAIFSNIPVTGGTTYTLSGYVRRHGGTSNLHLAADYYNGPTYTGSLEKSFSLAETPVGEWVRLSATFTALATATAMVPIFAFQGAGSGLDGFYLDAVQVEYGSIATPYVDGSLGAGYLWEASENLLTFNGGDQSFESSVGGWWYTSGGGGGSVTTGTAAGAVSGTKSLYLQPSGNGARFASPPFACVVDTVYTFSVWLWAYTTRSVTVGITDNAFAEIANTTVTLPSMSWTRVVVTGKASSSQQFAVAYIVTNDHTTDVLHVDAAQVEQKDHATPYGSTGAPNASSSRRETAWVAEPSTLKDWECARKVSIYFDPQITNYVGNTSGAAPSNYGWSLGVEAAVDGTLGPYLTKYTPDPEDPSAIALSSAYFVDYPGDTVPVPPAPEDSLASTEVYYTAAHMAVTPGQVWTALGEAKPPPGDTAGDPARFGRIGIRLYSGSTYLSTVPGPEVQLIRNVWTTLPALELTVPDGATYDHIEVAVITEGPCGFRHIALEDTNQHAAFFFDGSSASTTSDFLWTGTPFQSSTMFYDRRSFRTVRLRGLLIDFLPHGSCYDILFAGAPVSSPASISGVNPDPATSLPL